MISFQSLCEWLTCGQRYSWFYYPTVELTPEEQALVHVEPVDSTMVRIFYPREKFITASVLNKEDELKILRTKLSHAIEVLDMRSVKTIQERIKQIKET